ncbi:Aminodeoxychorismate lyase [Candida viswanathii]|uniref:Aminodeoxychorismate lyase n=1 Tax=Candida viswanathii TaxID=5486 RepID=A0A367XPX4_9ASCO|nr:Aminodeoxychorismate lyase [Candida viswanathii]
MGGSYSNSSLINEIHQEYINKNFPSEKDSAIDPDGFEILSTIRYDPNLTPMPPLTYKDITLQNFFLLPEHAARLMFSVNFFHLLYGTMPDFDITETFLFTQLVQAMEKDEKSVLSSYKLRVLLKLDGLAKIEVHLVPDRDNLLGGIFPGIGAVPEELEFLNHHPDSEEEVTWDVYIDKKPTLISPFTSFKTTKRDVYSEARKVLPGKKPGKEEVVLYNTQNNVMEGSITNIAVKRESDGKWVTPLLSSGCLCGVTRHFLLRKKFIEEDTISMDKLKPGTDVLLMNGIIGVVKGTVVE